MSNVVHCPHCGAPCEEIESDGKKTLRAFSLEKAEKKIEQLKSALMRMKAKGTKTL